MNQNTAFLQLDDFEHLDFNPEQINYSKGHNSISNTLKPSLFLVDTRKRHNLETKITEEKKAYSLLDIAAIETGKYGSRYSVVWDKRTYKDDWGESHTILGGHKFMSETQKNEMVQSFITYSSLIDGAINQTIEALQIAREKLSKRTFIDRAEKKVTEYILRKIDEGDFKKAFKTALDAQLENVYETKIKSIIKEFDTYQFSIEDSELKTAISRYTSKILEKGSLFFDKTEKSKYGSSSLSRKEDFILGSRIGYNPKIMQNFLKEYESHFQTEKKLEKLAKDKTVPSLKQMITIMDNAKITDTRLRNPTTKLLSDYTSFEENLPLMYHNKDRFAFERFLDEHAKKGLRFDMREHKQIWWEHQSGTYKAIRSVGKFLKGIFNKETISSLAPEYA